MSGINLSSLSDADRAALLAQAVTVVKEQTASKKDEATRRQEAYGRQLGELVTSVIEQEDVKTSDKWEGYSLRGIPVVIEGHTVTVSVTITDPVATAQRQAALAVKVAEERKAAQLAAQAAS